MRVVYFGSGEFGVPTLRSLGTRHEIVMVVTQPDRPAGRHRVMTPTPVATLAAMRAHAIIKPADVNEPAVVNQIQHVQADAFVVIAYGQKIGQELLRDRFAINLHASLLPKYRGAAPINWAIILGEACTGVTVITLAQMMDAGFILGSRSTPIDPNETAGELHDRLAELGPDLVEEVLQARLRGELAPRAQCESLATHARKLAKADGTVRFDQPADAVRGRIHGLTPWPGCTIRIDGKPLQLLRAAVADEASHDPPGTVLGDLTIACQPGTIRILEVKPPGGRAMSFDAYQHGHGVRAGARCEPA